MIASLFEQQHVEEEFETSSDIDVQIEGISNIQCDLFNMWFQQVVLNFNSNKSLPIKKLSDKEINFIRNNNIEKGVDCAYALMAKYTTYTFECQLSLVMKALDFLAKMRIPKEFAGGYLILICKYHFLP